MLTPFEERALRSLSTNPLFVALGAPRMHRVRRIALRRGELLFEKGDPCDHVYGLVSGQVKLFSHGQRGRQVTLDLLGPGELLGTVGVTDGAPQHASAVALAHCELAALTREHLNPLLAASPQVRSALFRAQSESVRRLTHRLEDAAFLDIEARVERVLADLGSRLGERIERGTRIRLRQQDLAEVLGVSRESVSRALTSSALRQKLEVGRGSILLLGV